MRILRVRYWGQVHHREAEAERPAARQLRPSGVLCALLLAGLPLLAQQGGGAAGGGTSTPPPATGGANTGGGGSTGGGRGGPTTGGLGGLGTTTTSTTPAPQRLLYITGNVVLDDGTVPSERVLIQRVCSTNSVHNEGYTDSKGRFSLQIGANLTQFVDASTPTAIDANAPGGFSTVDANPALAASSNPATELVFWSCELRGKLNGYRSETISLAGRRYLDSPAIGTIVLHAMAKTDGLMISATSASASKDARKAFEKGVKESRKERYDKAETELRKAVDLHPNYAEAWLELGRALEKLFRPDEARDAYQKAIDADSRFVYPYVELYELAFNQRKFQELADLTSAVVRLDPYEFPLAYYYNAVANLQLKHFDVAEQSARQAIQADNLGQNPKTHYVLGMIQVQTRDYEGARDSLRTFVERAPNDPIRSQVDDILTKLDRALGTTAAAEP